MIKTINPQDLAIPELHGLLLGAVAPRPIALASTVDGAGKVNLSPFSFFNVFSANPPILVFSPARRGRDNSTKDTYDNVLATKEVCINVVNQAIVQQVSLSSTEYEKGVNEFVKSGLTEVVSLKIKPPRVLESPVSFECVVNEVKPLGSEGGAGNLVICEIVMIHLDEEILDAKGKIDPIKLDPVARMGGDWYSCLSEQTVFEVAKPLQKKGIGIDQLPDNIRTSTVLTGNELAMLANVESLPTQEEIISELNESERGHFSTLDFETRQQSARGELARGLTKRAWAILLS